MTSLTKSLGSFQLTVLAMLSLAATGCYVPLHSPGVPCCSLPCEYRLPERSAAPSLILTNLTVPAPEDYILGANDTLEVTIPGLFQQAEVRPIRVRIMADETVTLPLVGKVKVGGLNLSDAQTAIEKTYADGFLQNPRVSLDLAEVHTIDVTVIGEVTNPGVHQLPRYQNDIGHALGLAGGMLEFADEVIEVHRRVPTNELQQRFGRLMTVEPKESPSDALEPPPAPIEPVPAATDAGDLTEVVLRIPLRGGPITVKWESGYTWLEELGMRDVTLESGDVVVIPRKTDEVFFVVGPLDRTNVVNFTVRARDRELGNAFLLPPNRDIDVISAVAMAGYIDPIDSPSTVTVHRQTEGSTPLLVHVDLIKARFDWNENMYVQPGDIIYLNPDCSWWFRRTFDRVVPALIAAPYNEAMYRWINPRAFLGGGGGSSR